MQEAHHITRTKTTACGSDALIARPFGGRKVTKDIKRETGRHANLINDAAVRSLVHNPEGPAQQWVKDKTNKGFYIRLGINNTKTWYYHYTFEGKRSFFKLGEYPAISCSEAFTSYGKYLTELRRGVNPKEQRQQLKKAQAIQGHKNKLTVSVLFDSHYLPRYAKPNKATRKKDLQLFNHDMRAGRLLVSHQLIAKGRHYYRY